MTTGSPTPRLQHPAHRVPDDEGLHAPPAGAEDRLFGDTVWLSLIDPEQRVWGLLHNHISTNRGLGRFAAYLSIDGVEQVYLGTARQPFAPGAREWSNGDMTYRVVEPYERIDVELDCPRFALDLRYTARHITFDYDDCLGGNPLEGLKPAAGIHGGHYEQAMDVRGTLTLRRGPASGEVRQIDAIAHRDHTWSDRFANDAPWAYPDGVRAALHFWHVLQFPSRNINVTGFYDLSALGIERDIDRVGGFESTPEGVRRVAACVPAPGPDGGRTEPEDREGPLRWRITFEDGETIHVVMTRVVQVHKLRMLGEDDAESRLDDYESFGELLIEETGERGVGELEHSLLPPAPRWLA